jgi:homocysteine S-methyltransferase
MKGQFESRLRLGTPLLLDGATGTELNRRGVNTGLPLWSANALVDEIGRTTLLQIHMDYVRAGADIITTNTFRTHRRALSRQGGRERAFELTSCAVAIAREAIRATERDAGDPVFLAGSISTLEDCYRPDLVPADDQLKEEHSERIYDLCECGVDLILVETMNTIREARICASLAVQTEIPVIVSFVCDTDGKILSGESLMIAAEQLLPVGVSALGVNCAPASSLVNSLERLRAICGDQYPLIGYGNIGYADDRFGWVNTDAVDPQAYCGYAAKWPVRILGGCCGTTPAHILELRRTLLKNPGHGRINAD